MSEQVFVIANGRAEPRDRTATHREGWLHYCAHLLCHDDDLLYLQRRSATLPRNPAAWTSTVSGHIAAADARADVSSGAVGEWILQAALLAIKREAFEELHLRLNEQSGIEYLGQVSSISKGGGELCNCRALVFQASLRVTATVTDEVQDVSAFRRSEIRRALEVSGSLRAKDGRLYPLADNFAPVFSLYEMARTSSGAYQRASGAGSA